MQALAIKPQPFGIGASVRESLWLIRLAGDLDLTTSAQFLSAVADCLAQHARTVILDLRPLAFMDSEGVHALLRAKQQAARHGCTLYLTHPSSGLVQRVITLVGLDRVIPTIDIPPSCRG